MVNGRDSSKMCITKQYIWELIIQLLFWGINKKNAFIYSLLVRLLRREVSAFRTIAHFNSGQ